MLPGAGELIGMAAGLAMSELYPVVAGVAVGCKAEGSAIQGCEVPPIFS